MPKPKQRRFGRAIDINTRQNPYILYNPDMLEVVDYIGDQWDPAVPGTLAC